ncbi:hypothetical protein A0256_20780 [Mucilaginibacter sp. PAMC 26640]|jgi:hypothetical protein|nr:hypothetical protein A0256_20780 [Mucilaginibacter sp. PAMC 26640]
MNDQYKGMTVNERLYVAGLIDDFYEAIKDRDVNKVIVILKKVELGDESIDPILEFNGLKPPLGRRL